ncbi:MAG: NUDIX hydrolase, partial [Acidimicrobiales bacterium]
MVAVRDAATVMLVRDPAQGPGGAERGAPEVFMLRRSLTSTFVGGAYVFPGGAVDPADRSTDLERVCEGRTDADASARLGIEAGGLAYWVAAIRECFEEAGVLVAYRRPGELASMASPDVASRFAGHRADVYTGRRSLVEVCEEEGLRLAVDRVHYFSHWVTPVGPPRRYDTRFFVARVPGHQAAREDEGETIAHLWASPAAALDRHRRGELDMILPTIKNLEAVSRFATTDELLAAAAGMAAVPRVAPRVVRDGDGARILLPGDPGY